MQLTITTLDDTRSTTFVPVPDSYGRRGFVLADAQVRVSGVRAGYISRRHSFGPWLEHRQAAALGLRILRAQQLEPHAQCRGCDVYLGWDEAMQSDYCARCWYGDA